MVLVSLHEVRPNPASLQENEERFRTLAEHAPDIIARFDRRFRHLYVNARAEAASGLSRQQLLGRSNAELGFSPQLVELWHSSFERVFATGRPEVVEFSYGTGGDESHYEAKLVPELAEDGSVSSLLALTRDVTAWKKAQLELREADRRKSDFIAVLSHELRNPLARSGTAWCCSSERLPGPTRTAERTRCSSGRRSSSRVWWMTCWTSVD